MVDCSVRNLKCVGENRKGLSSDLIFLCTMCNVSNSIFCVENKKKDEIDINTAACACVQLAGVGYTILQKVFTKIDMPMMSTSIHTLITVKF